MMEYGNKTFKTRPEPLHEGGNKGLCIGQFRGVSLGSDAFFPFDDNIERAQKKRRFVYC